MEGISSREFRSLLQVAEQLSTLLDPFLSGYRRFAERSQIENKAEVLVQECCDDIQVLFCESFDELANELHLGRIGGLRVGHFAAK